MFPKRFSLYCLFGVIKQKRKTLVEYENCPPPPLHYALVFFVPSVKSFLLLSLLTFIPL